MFKRLTCFIEKHNILCDRQFGFREKHSTSHSTLLIADRVQQAIENGKYSCGIFLDFSKAFDTVNHNILLKKLDHYRVRGTAKAWFISYLSNRKQHVSVGTSKSDDLYITHGVPQGSVLGPLLFLLLKSMILVTAVNFSIFTFLQMTQIYLYTPKSVCIRNIY